MRPTREPEQNSRERREVRRFSLRLPIQTWLEAAPGWHYNAHTVNISSRGVLFSLDCEDLGSFHLAAPLSFNVGLGAEADTRVILQGKGRVVRVDHGGDTAPDRPPNTRIAAIFTAHRIVRVNTNTEADGRLERS